MNARTVETHGVSIATEAFGDASNPAILLLMGAMASATWWPEGFCEQLAPGEAPVPGIDLAVLAWHAQAATLDWSDRKAVLDYQVGAWRLLNGSAHAFDEAHIRELATADYDRTPNPLTAFNHATLRTLENWSERMGEIRAPSLIIHGTEDRVLPYAHALALHTALPGSQLLTLEGTGHELHPADWPVILDAIERHTA